MSAIRTNHRCLGWFLLFGIPLLITILWMGIVSNAPWWVLMLMLPLVLPFFYLIPLFLTDYAVIVIGDGYMLLPRPFLKSVRIPLDHIRTARIMEPWADEGRAYFLEIALTNLTPELEHWSHTVTKRQTLKWCHRPGGYEPPPEPFLIFQIPPLNVSDRELSAIVERERTLAGSIRLA